MSVKDLLVVISEMLRKQDQQAEKSDLHSAMLGQHTGILNQHTEILNEHTALLKRQIDISNKQTDAIFETNKKLQQFMEVSIHQCQEQHKFRKEQIEFNLQFSAQNNQFSLQFEKQNEFNKRLLNKLTDIETALKK